MTPRPGGDAAIADHVATGLSSGAPLTVLRAPHGFGKTSALTRWMQGEQSASTIVYARLTPSCRQGAEVFWREIVDALDDAGLHVPEPVPEGGFERVRRAVLATRVPLILVIDDYHHSGDGGDRILHVDQLIDLLRAAPHFRLVAACRWPCSLEVMGALSVDTLVLAASDLALTAEQTTLMAERRGLTADPEAVERLLSQVGGWPVAVRASLDTSARRGGEIEVDQTFVDRAVAMVHGELESKFVRDFALRVAVPEELDERIVEAIIDRPSATGLLPHMYEAGVISRRRTSEGTRYGFPPAIRASLLRLLRETAPAAVHEVHRRLMPLVYRATGPIGAIRHACRAEEWQLAAQILEQDWSLLLTMDRAELVALAQLFPPEIVRDNPRLAVARDALVHLPRERNPGLEQWSSIHAGYFATASHLLEQSREDEVSLLMQWGVGSVLSADNDAAAFAFRRVHEIGAEAADERVIGLGSVGLTAVTTIAGEVDEALRWADVPEVSRLLEIEHPEQLEDKLTSAALVVARIFVALAAVDAMAPDAPARLRAIIAPQRRDDVWAMAWHARAQHDIVAGTREEIGRHVSMLRAALRHLDPGGVTEATLVTGLAEVLMQLKMADAAASVLDEVTDSHVVAPTRAFVHLVRGEVRDALDLAQRALGNELTTLRGRLAAQLTCAAAFFLLDHRRSAEVAFGEAVRIARESGQRRFFSLLPRDMVADLAGGLEQIADVYRGEAVAGSPLVHRDGAPNGRGESTLSEREETVIEALRRHTGPAGIGEELGLSANTVKTHLRNIYRKLGAHGREEALRLHHAPHKRGDDANSV